MAQSSLLVVRFSNKLRSPFGNLIVNNIYHYLRIYCLDWCEKIYIRRLENLQNQIVLVITGVLEDLNNFGMMTWE